MYVQSYVTMKLCFHEWLRGKENNNERWVKDCEHWMKECEFEHLHMCYDHECLCLGCEHEHQCLHCEPLCQRVNMNVYVYIVNMNVCICAMSMCNLGSLWVTKRELEWFWRFANDYEGQTIWLSVTKTIKWTWVIVNDCEHWTSISDYQNNCEHLSECEHLWVYVNDYEWLWESVSMNDYEHQVNMSDCEIFEQFMNENKE
jgi:hypothetical protein